MDTSSSTVSLKYQRATRNLARSPIHQSLQLSSTGAGHDAPPSSSSSCQNLSPQGKQNSLDTGITKAELQKSFVDCLTEPSSSTGAGKEAANGGLDRFKKQKLGVSLGLQVAVWLEQVVRVVRHFKVYLQHLGIALVTAVAVVLACSLRGKGRGEGKEGGRREGRREGWEGGREGGGKERGMGGREDGGPGRGREGGEREVGGGEGRANRRE